MQYVIGGAVALLALGTMLVVAIAAVVAVVLASGAAPSSTTPELCPGGVCPDPTIEWIKPSLGPEPNYYGPT